LKRKPTVTYSVINNMKELLYIFILIAGPIVGKAQTVSGSWFGRADVDLAGLHNNYLTELVIKQKGTRVEGIFGYYFRDKYQSYFVHGRYNPKTREIIILNLPVIYFNSNSTVNNIDCMTNFRGILINSRVSSSLTGVFYHDEKYKYTCPDLKVSYVLDRSDHEEDSVATAVSARAKMWKPQADDYVVDEVKAPPLVVTAATPDSTAVAPTAVAQTAVGQMVTVGQTAVAPTTAFATVGSDKVRGDSAKVVAGAPQVTASAAPQGMAAPVQTQAVPVAVRQDSLKIVESFVKRKAVLNRELLVESDSIRLSFYDNGEIDGDSISVFVNHELVLSHQELAAKAFNIYLHLDSTRELTEISMFAENLGRLPPNTALMVVTDGKNRYEVFLSSSLTENATIELRRKR